MWKDNLFGIITLLDLWTDSLPYFTCKVTFGMAYGIFLPSFNLLSLGVISEWNL